MPKSDRERVHFHLAPTVRVDAPAVLDRVVALGATRLDTGDACPGAIGFDDVDGNQFCLVEPSLPPTG
jgi:hypothetical protein